MRIIEFLIFVLLILLAMLQDKIIVIKIVAITIVITSVVCVIYDIAMLIKNKEKKDYKNPVPPPQK